MELHEAIAAQAYSPDLEGSIDFRTANYLYGYQLGTEANLWDAGGRLRLDGFLKAGIYGNFTRFNLDGEGTYFAASGTATHRRTSFLGELGLTANYRLTPHCSAVAGYEVMWIEGVVLAGDAIAAMQNFDGDLLWNGGAFYHGALAGLTFTW